MPRKRKRNYRRNISCPINDCHIQSTGEKYRLTTLYEDIPTFTQQERSRDNIIYLTAAKIPCYLEDEWLECFWCSECNKNNFYHVKKWRNGSYQALPPIATSAWNRAVGVAYPEGIPGISQYSQRFAKGASCEPYFRN